jgi:F-type H+-transporting ATPase subunit a
MEIDVFGYFRISITQTVLASFAVMITLCILSWRLGKNLQKRPGRRQVLVEKGVSMIYNLVSDTMGSHNMRFAPYIGALFLSSLLGSLISTTGIFRSPTADLSTTVTWALMTTGLVWYHNMKNNGFLGWLKGFAQPVAVMTPINIVSEIAQPISMSFRHFGNIAGGSVLTALVYGGLASLSSLLLGWIPNALISSIPILQVGVPAFLSMYFDLFSGGVQALVFVLLTMVYVGAACPPPQENELPAGSTPAA